MTIEQELLEIRQENPDKKFEILEGEIREVLENEGILVRENPLDFPASVQRKYFGSSAEDWKAPIDWNADDKEKEIPNGFFVYSEVVQNPYTKKSIVVNRLQEIPKPSLSEIKSQIIDGSLTEKPKDVTIPPLDIGQIIIEKNFGGNINAQLAGLSKSIVKILAVLCQIIGKDKVKYIFSEEITLARSISETRVTCGLSPFDLSFLD